MGKSFDVVKVFIIDMLFATIMFLVIAAIAFSIDYIAVNLLNLASSNEIFLMIKFLKYFILFLDFILVVLFISKSFYTSFLKIKYMDFNNE